MNTKQIFKDNFTTNPYWWDAAPPETAMNDVPAKVDIVIVGSGYCGMNAAAELARLGEEVVVIDEREIGGGGSTRSGGMVSSGQKLVVTNTIQGVSAERRQRLLNESMASYDYLKHMIESEHLDADLKITGRFFGAYTPSHFDRLIKQGQMLRDITGVTVHDITREAQSSVVGTSRYYYGGILVDDYGGVHTAKYHRSLRQLASQRGAKFCSHAGVKSVEKMANGHFKVITVRGTVEAKRVIMATNGYTHETVPFLQRRVIPVASYQVATEELPEGLMEKVNPGRRMISDSKHNLYYIRPSPDGKRMLLGNRPGIFEMSEQEAAKIMHDRLVEVWPEMADIKLTHSWKGYVCMTWDKLTHIGQHDGLYYAVGCNGNGVALMSYLGYRMARMVAGQNDPACAFAEGEFPSGWLPGDQTWVVPFGAALYTGYDKLASLSRQ